MTDELERQLQAATALVDEVEAQHERATTVRDELIGAAYRQGAGIREIARATEMAYASVHNILTRDGHHVQTSRPS